MKVLVVDNHPVILKFMKDLLEREGHRVMTAEDGLLALDILQNYTPEVIFVDLIMPNIEGKKLCQIIRAMPGKKDACLVVLSAIAAEDQEINFAEFGADACIAKGPFKSMAENILTVLETAGNGSMRRLPETVIGIRSVYPREITKELMSAKRHFEKILGNMSEGILETTSEGRVVYANPTALSLVGVPEEKLLGSSFVELFAETHRQRIEHLLNSTATTPQSISEDSPLNLHDKQLTMSVVPFNGNRHTRMAIIIMSDVSERKRMESQLLMAQKLEAIGTLAGGIAHDFNNLLMGILGNASMMLVDVDTGHPHYEKLNSIEKLVKSGAKLTSQLLGYARKGRYEVKPVNLNQLVAETSETFARTRKEITIHRKLAQDLLAIEADEGQIEQVLFNLYVNAADAMTAGGDLILETINCSHQEMEGRLYDPKPGNYALLTVTDTGTGIDEETMKRIFDPFFTTKEMGRGTGLGLASVYGIIKGHGGYVDVDSKKGKGTAFKIYLPATEKEIAKLVSMRNKVIKGSETILLVDDEEMIRSIGQDLLKALGYKSLVSKSGKEAVEVYKQHSNQIDLVILDMVMPSMGGGETFDKLKALNPHIKVILSSGYSINGEASEIMARGCNGFIQKPFDMNQLSETIRSVLENN